MLTDLAGNVGPMGPGLLVTIDTIAPVAPRRRVARAPTPACRARRATRTASPTSRQPDFRGTVEPNATVTLFVDSKAAGTAIADPTTGVYTLTSSRPLTSGAEQRHDRRDRPGGQRQPRVSRSAGGPPRHDAAAGDHAGTGPASDTGTSNNDGSPRSTTPTFTGTAEISPFFSANPTRRRTDGALVQIFAQLVVAAGQPTSADRSWRARRWPPDHGRVLGDGRPVRQPAAAPAR